MTNPQCQEPAQVVGREMIDFLAPLRLPVFRRLWLANMGSTLGVTIQAVGASWFVLSATGSPQMVSLVQTCVTLPILMLSLVSGVLADTFNRRKIMLLAQSYMFLVTSLLAILVAARLMTPGLMLFFTFLIGCGGAIHLTSWQASLRDIAKNIELPAIVSAHSFGINVARSTGPALGGLLLAAIGASAFFSLNALCFAVMAVTLALWKTRPRVETSREPFGWGIVSGLRYSALSPNLVRILSRGSVFTILGASLTALLPVVAVNFPSGGPVLYGALLASFGLGALLAATFSPNVRRLMSLQRLTSLAATLSALAILLVAFGGTEVAAFAGTFIVGFCWVLNNATLNVTVQLSTPKWVEGRSLSILHTCFFGGMALGSWLWGLIAEQMGLTPALTWSAVSLLLAAVIGSFWPLSQEIPTDLDPANRFVEPEARLEMTRASGAVSVSVIYRIAEADVPAFLELMKRRRVVRRRDGAMRWRLLRNVEDPREWTERYEVPTWDEYLRHNRRRTKSDMANLDGLLALHVGPGPIIVRRMVEWARVPDTDDAPTRSEVP